MAFRSPTGCNPFRLHRTFAGPGSRRPAGRSAARGSLLLPVLALLGVAAVLAASGSAQASMIRLDLSFEAPVVTQDPAGGSRVAVPGCEPVFDPGKPVLPYSPQAIVLAPGEQVIRVRAIPAQEQVVAGPVDLAPGQPPRPISAAGPFPPTPPDAAVYGSDAPFPSDPAHLVTEQTGFGHRLAFLRVCPVVYRPASRSLAWYPTIRLEIETAPIAGVDARRIENLRRTPEALERLGSLVANPDDLALYETCETAPTAAGRVDPGFFPYVIVTTEPLAEAYQELAVYETSRGLPATIVLMSWIEQQYEGIDAAQKLRAFVLDAYQSWQTRYLLLGGDYDAVPVRNLYVDAGGTIDAFPGDCYYEGLDGTWNADGDDRWGEWDEFDLVGEVAAGRVTAHDPLELSRWMHKNRMYAEHPVVSELTKALFIGERMDDVPTYSCIYMDRLTYYTCEFGYCTYGYPDAFQKEMLCDENGYSWTSAELIALYNQGFPTSHHLGHSGTDYNMKMYNADLAALTNDGVSHSYAFISSQGCYANNFDANWTQAFSEVATLEEHAASAYLGNTRYGWYCPGWATGPSQHYDRQFVDARYGEGIGLIGDCNVDSKVDNVAILDAWNLWCHYELCLLGDPALPQWGSSRGTLSLLHTGAFTMGQEAYSVRVLCNGLPVAQAAVTIWADDLSTAVTGQTNAQGVVLLSPTPNYPAPLHVKAVKLDYLPGEGTIAVDPGQQPWIVWGATSLDDDGAGASIGDGDGEADAGERIEMYLSLENIGHIASTALTVTVSCDNPHVTIEQGQAGYDPIAGGQSGENLTPFLVRIAPDAIDGESTRWTAEITDGGQRIWIEEFDLTLHAPILSLASWSIEDQANGDGEGDIDPNEPFLLHVVLHNSGSDGAREISATLTANTSDVALPVAESGLASLPASGSAELDPPFAGSVSASIPTEGFVHFEIAMTTWCGQPFQAAFDARIDSYVEDLFETESGWTAGAPGDDALRGFWVRVDPVGTWRNGRIVQTEDDHTPEGTFCFVTGNGNPGDQAPVSDIDGGRTTLLSPVYDLSGAIDPRLVYWRWYTNNEGFNGNQDWWVVEITDDGGASWVSLENTTESETAWRRMEFRLADYVDPAAHVQVRFMASDEGYDSIVEAGVDDFSIESVLGPAGAESPALEPVRFGIRSIAPNPAAGVPAAGQTIAIEFALEEAAPYRVGVYDVTGALVRAYEGAAQPAGVRRILFDGRDRRGHPLAGGIYFVRLQSQEREASGKLILLGR